MNINGKCIGARKRREASLPKQRQFPFERDARRTSFRASDTGLGISARAFTLLTRASSGTRGFHSHFRVPKKKVKKENEPGRNLKNFSPISKNYHGELDKGWPKVIN